MIPLWKLCKAGDVTAARAAIDGGQEFNTVRDSKGSRTGLIWAACRGHVEVVDLLLEKGDDVNAMDEDGQTALYWACRNGHAGVIRSLLTQTKINCNQTFWDTISSCAMTPLMVAVKWARVEAVRVMAADPRVEVETRNGKGETPIMWAVKQGKRNGEAWRQAAEVVNALMEDGRVDLSTTDAQGKTLEERAR
jgi:ankyrin repeat protein